MKNKLLAYLVLSLMIYCFSTIVFANRHHEHAKPFPPFRIAGNLYYVGNSYTASYLVATPQGNILINSDYEDDVPDIKASIEKLGFKFKDTKILLISHAHVDHAGGSALVKSETGAKYMVMAPDVSVVESGGRTDFNFGNKPKIYYPPAKVDRVLHDGDQVKLGNTVLTAHLTPGHTKGCTTWTMQVTENGKKYNVVIVGSPTVLAEYHLVHNKQYPQIAKDYEHTFQVLKTLPCDIFLGAHGSFFNLQKKYALMQKEGVNAFVDPEGYKKFVAEKEQEFYTQLQAQTAAAAK